MRQPVGSLTRLIGAFALFALAACGPSSRQQSKQQESTKAQSPIVLQNTVTSAEDNCGLTAYPTSRSTREILATVAPEPRQSSSSQMLAKVAIDADGKLTHLQVVRLAYPAASNTEAINERAVDSVKN